MAWACLPPVACQAACSRTREGAEPRAGRGGAAGRLPGIGGLPSDRGPSCRCPVSHPPPPTRRPKLLPPCDLRACFLSWGLLIRTCKGRLFLVRFRQPCSSSGPFHGRQSSQEGCFCLQGGRERRTGGSPGLGDAAWPRGERRRGAPATPPTEERLPRSQ